MHQTPKGIPVPDPGDDLLASYEAGFNAAGIVVPFASIAAMRTALAAAAQAGAPASTAHPWYGDVNGVLYRSVGTRNASGVYAIEAVNAPEWKSSYGGPVGIGTHTLPAGSALKVTYETLPVKPYDRMVFGIGSLWAKVQSGTADLELRMNGTFFKARLPEVDDQNVTVAGAILLKAGITPNFEVCAVAAGGKAASIRLVSDEWTRITLMAWPVSMA